MLAVVTLTDSPPTKEGRRKTSLQCVFARDTALLVLFSFASPSSAFRVGEACRRRRRRKHFNGFGVAGNGEFNWGELDLEEGDPTIPSDIAKTTFPPQFVEQTEHTGRRRRGVGNANELGFSLSQRVTARSEQHLSAFGIFRSFAKIDLATAVQCQLGAGRGGTDSARVLLRLTANLPRHLNYSNVSSLFIADCQATTAAERERGKETDNRRRSPAFEIGTVDWRTAGGLGRRQAGQWQGRYEMIIRDATTPLELKCDARNNAAADEQVCNLAARKEGRMSDETC